ncbi:MAG: DUF1449 family protein [Alphaproteobacteria bacterium]|nr:MAG: DUF1449 family protein [Alphaproteobacteria bacterium]
MIQFLTHPANLPFSVSLALMLMIGLIEGLGMLVGFAFSSLLDNLLPDVDLDVDAPDLADHGAFSEFLSWLRFREVPVIAILVAFLTSFSITGFVLQQVSFGVLGFMLPAVVAGAIAFFLSLPGVRLFAGVLSKIMPKDETEAVSRDSFIGRPATITLGTARRGGAAQAKLKDKHGQTHYVLVEPDDDDASFAQGDSVLILCQVGSVFHAIPNDNKHMLD